MLAAKSFRTQGRGTEAAAFLIFALGCIAVAGEEISWGQRILGLDTPKRLEETNVQDELNAHNIFEVRMVLKFAMIGVGLYGFAVPLLFCMRVLRLGPRLALAVPPLFLTSGFAVLAGYNLGRLVFFPRGFFGVEQNETLARFGEWPEFCLGFALASFAFLLWRRLGTETAFEWSERDAPKWSEPGSEQPV